MGEVFVLSCVHRLWQWDGDCYENCFRGVLGENKQDSGVRLGKRKKWKLNGNSHGNACTWETWAYPQWTPPQVTVASLTHSGVKEACHSFWLGLHCPSPEHIQLFSHTGKATLEAPVFPFHTEIQMLVAENKNAQSPCLWSTERSLSFCKWRTDALCCGFL